MCAKIAANSPLAVQGAKHILRYAEDHTMNDTLAYIGNLLTCSGPLTGIRTLEYILLGV